MTDTTIKPQMNIAQEYVVAQRRPGNRLLALPWAFDDITHDFGDDLYDRMALDARVAACDVLLRAAIAEDGYQLAPAIENADDPRYELAVEILTLCERNLDDLETPLDDVLWDMLGCLGRGNRIAEITYHPLDGGPAYIASICPKPRRSTAFAVNVYGHVAGVLGQTETTTITPGVQLQPGDPRILPREKFAIATYRPHDGDPRGTSAWRAAYNAWWLKMQAWQEYIKYLAQFASGTVIGKTAQNARDRVLANGEHISATQDLLNSLLELHNGSAISVPYGTEVDVLFSQGEGKAFLNAINLFNNEITIAITTQTLASGEGEHASRAQASVHQDALETLVRQGKRSLCRMLRRDVLRHLVRYNYGDAAIDLTPRVSLGETEAVDLPGLINAFAALQRSGYIHPSQQSGIDRMLNLPPRIIEEVGE